MARLLFLLAAAAAPGGRAGQPACSPLDLTCLVRAEPQAHRKQVPGPRVGEVPQATAPGARGRRRLCQEGTVLRLLPVVEDLRDCFELRAAWSRSRASAEALARRAGELEAARGPPADGAAPSQPLRVFWGEDGWRQLLESGVEVVDVVLPFYSQPDFIEAALKRGVGVVSEKPAAPAVAEGRALARLAQGGRASWSVAENWRFEAPFRAAARLREAGAIGSVVAFEAVSTSYVPDDHPYLSAGSWRDNWVLDVGVHIVAALRLVLGGSPTLSGVSTASVRPTVRPFDTFSASLALPAGGGRAASAGAWLFSLSAAKPAVQGPGLADLHLRVIGSKGSLTASRTALELRDAEGQILNTTRTEPGRSVSAALRAAALVELRAGAGEAVSAAEALADLELVEAILHAAGAPAAAHGRREEEL